MANNKLLTLDNRSRIQAMLNDRASFKEIADALDKSPLLFLKKSVHTLCSGESVA